MSEPPEGLYLASEPATAPGSRSTDDLDLLQDGVVTRRLEALLHDISETVSEVRERHAKDTDPAPVDSMRACCARADAPLALRSLLNRVEAGRLTWEQVWRHPGEHDGGMQLLGQLACGVDVEGMGTWS